MDPEEALEGLPDRDAVVLCIVVAAPGHDFPTLAEAAGAYRRGPLRRRFLTPRRLRTALSRLAGRGLVEARSNGGKETYAATGDGARAARVWAVEAEFEVSDLPRLNELRAAELKAPFTRWPPEP